MAHLIGEAAALVTILGYLTAARGLWQIAIPNHVRWRGVAFFLTCSGTHVVVMVLIHRYEEQSIFLSPFWLVWHAVESMAIWSFIHGVRSHARSS